METSFASLGVPSVVCNLIESLAWTSPTQIQKEVIPHALQKHDIVALAETGSGKTGAFVIPIITFLLEHPSRYFAVIVVPTRELALQICDVCEAVGVSLGLITACLVGGISLVDQAIQLAKGPHVLICTPGRLVDHLQNTKGFSLRNVKVVVFDEADRLLSLDFEREINYILSVTPNRLQTYLFSATMTKKVHQLQNSFLKTPIEVSVTSSFQIPKRLVQQYVFVPAKWKDCYLAHSVQTLNGQSVIIFTSTCAGSLRLATILENLGHSAVSLHGHMPQSKRIGAINKFRGGLCNILVATDVASRGLDIPDVDAVFNFDLPLNAKIYVHRVGRTARNGKTGRSISFVTQYDIEAFQQLETLLGSKLPEFQIDEREAVALQERVEAAQKVASIAGKEILHSRKKRMMNVITKKDESDQSPHGKRQRLRK